MKQMESTVFKITYTVAGREYTREIPARTNIDAIKQIIANHPKKRIVLDTIRILGGFEHVKKTKS